MYICAQFFSVDNIFCRSKSTTFALACDQDLILKIDAKLKFGTKTVRLGNSVLYYVVVGIKIWHLWHFWHVYRNLTFPLEIDVLMVFFPWRLVFFTGFYFFSLNFRNKECSLFRPFRWIWEIENLFNSNIIVCLVLQFADYCWSSVCLAVAFILYFALDRLVEFYQVQTEGRLNLQIITTIVAWTIWNGQIRRIESVESNGKTKKEWDKMK